jgi:tRNA threonylcarbamoyladenosine biosynthesis protein TsaE
MQRVVAHDEDRTFALGRALGLAAFPGAVFALSGDLGAGKTVLARGIAAGLGVTSGVASPTFVLMATHTAGRLPLWHADLYRVTDEDDLVSVGLTEVLHGDGVVVIEWADRFPSALPEDRLDIALTGDDERTITLEARGPRHAPLEAVRA